LIKLMIMLRFCVLVTGKAVDIKTNDIMMAFVLVAGMECMAATHYVVPTNSAAADPYTSWITAGTNIIDVVNAAMTNDSPRLIWVTNGTYYPTSHITITNTMTIQSVNGRDLTILHGGAASTNRCIAFRSAVTFDGFTVTNYCAIDMDGVIYVPSSGENSKILNCLVTGNRVAASLAWSENGGGIFHDYKSLTITNCIVRGNRARSYGGGIRAGANAHISDCVIENNTADINAGGGIAIPWYTYQDIFLSNCFIINNRGNSDGGGIYIDVNRDVKVVSCVITGNISVSGNGGGVWGNNTTVENCIITANRATNSNGGGVYGTNLNIKNCLVAQNAAKTNAGGVYFANGGTIMNCTVVSNYAGVSGGGLFITNAGYGTNNIIYHNTATVSADNFTNTTGNTGLNYSCVLPAVDGTGNITNDPRLVDFNGGNYRLRADSPCVNRGMNQDWMTNSYDLDGQTRIRYGRVDMGVYEAIYNGTVYAFH